MVKEDVTKKSQLTMTKQNPGPRVFYDKGVNLILKYFILKNNYNNSWAKCSHHQIKKTNMH